jgi:hypothetical protein
VVAPVIPALGRQRQKDSKFNASLGYTERSCLKKMNKLKQKIQMKTLRWKDKKQITKCVK